MKLLFCSTLLVSLLSTASVRAQNPIADLGGSTYREKTVYAVYDLRDVHLQADAIETIVLDTVRTFARDAQVRQGIPPSPYPAYPNQMTVSQRQSGGQKPDCAGELFSIEAFDSSMAKYGGKTYHRACVFPYASGYRINYFAIYGQQSGAGNANPNVLAAMLGRAMGSLVGLSDSSASINKLLGRLESNLQSAGIGFKLVQLHPKDMAGRTLVEDDLGRPIAQAPANLQQPAPTLPVAKTSETVLDGGTMPAALAKLQAALTQQREVGSIPSPPQ